MKIVVNGKVENTDQDTILNYILEKNLEPKTVIVEYNFKIVKKDTWNNVKIKDGDNLEILNFVGGG
jgi:sulfur carrier protein